MFPLFTPALLHPLAVDEHRLAESRMSVSGGRGVVTMAVVAPGHGSGLGRVVMSMMVFGRCLGRAMMAAMMNASVSVLGRTRRVVAMMVMMARRRGRLGRRQGQGRQGDGGEQYFQGGSHGFFF